MSTDAMLESEARAIFGSKFQRFLAGYEDWDGRLFLSFNGQFFLWGALWMLNRVMLRRYQVIYLLPWVYIVMLLPGHAGVGKVLAAYLGLQLIASWLIDWLYMCNARSSLRLLRKNGDTFWLRLQTGTLVDRLRSARDRARWVTGAKED